MYHSFDKKVLIDHSPEEAYNDGYVFTRERVLDISQIRSVRINLANFELSSENKRILNKTDFLSYTKENIPYTNYSWEIGKLAKDFYDSRGASFSANKIKELLTTTHNFNILFVYTEADATTPLGYAICFESDTILHYSYPFYDVEHHPKDTGLGMMLQAIMYAKESGKQYVYLGSLARYKLQFKGLEWFDGENWSSSIEDAKTILTEHE